MKYGIYYAYWEDQWKADYFKYIEKVAKLGFDFLEIACTPINGYSRQTLKDLRQAAKDNGIFLTAGHGPSADQNLGSPDAAVRRNAKKFFTTLLKNLETLDIHAIGGGIYSYWPVDYSKPIDKPGDWARAEGVKFVKEVDVPSVKVMLDTFHMNIEEDSIGGAIRSTKGLLGHFHTGECNRRVPGRGRTPWHEIALALKDIGYDGNVCMEPFVRMGGKVGEDIKIWRELEPGITEAKMDADAKAALDFERIVFEGV